jgi:hypothetical protein
MFDRDMLKKLGFAINAVVELFFFVLFGLIVGASVDKHLLGGTMILTVVGPVAMMAFGFFRLYKAYAKEMNGS